MSKHPETQAPSKARKKKIDILALQAKKERGERVTMLTAYDFALAKLVDEAEIDTILVGDSLGNVMLGYPDTVPVTMDQMIHHTRAVSRGVSRALVIGDMPFMSYQASTTEALHNAGRFIKEGRAEMVKLEGGGAMVAVVEAIVKIGIPVCGHLGLTPQTASALGGYRVQGRTAASARAILDDARRLEEAGCSLLVIECVPDRVAKKIAGALRIPVIGIGAGPDCDGQVLVLHDMLGLGGGFSPKFVQRFANLGEEVSRAVTAYRDAVVGGRFPAEAHSFTIPDDEYHRIG
jgi:3-methyl-2-oxobutanoate hydroxymethyltransferase